MVASDSLERAQVVTALGDGDHATMAVAIGDVAQHLRQHSVTAGRQPHPRKRIALVRIVAGRYQQQTPAGTDR